MTTVKRAVTIDKDLEREARALAGDNFSAFVNAALARQVRAVKLDRLVATDETERGPIPDDVLAEVDADMAALDAELAHETEATHGEAQRPAHSELSASDDARRGAAFQGLLGLGFSADEAADLLGVSRERLEHLRQRGLSQVVAHVEYHGEQDADALVQAADQALAEAVERVGATHRDLGVIVMMSPEPQGFAGMQERAPRSLPAGRTGAKGDTARLLIADLLETVETESGVLEARGGEAPNEQLYDALKSLREVEAKVRALLAETAPADPASGDAA